MQSRIFLLFGVILSITSVVSGGDGKDGKGCDWMEKMKKCGDGEINVEEAMKGVKECKEEVNSTETSSRRRRSADGEGEDKKKGKEMWGKNTCVSVCAWKKQGVLDDNGKFNETGAKEFADKVYPEKYRTDGFNSLKACADENSSTFSMDNNCEGYKKFKACTFGAHMKTCGIEWGKQKGAAGVEGGEE